MCKLVCGLIKCSELIQNKAIKLDFYVVPLILVDTLNAVEGAGLNVRPTNEQLQLDSKQTKSIWRIIIQMLFIARNGGMNYGRLQNQLYWRQ